VGGESRIEGQWLMEVVDGIQSGIYCSISFRLYLFIFSMISDLDFGLLLLFEHEYNCVS